MNASPYITWAKERAGLRYSLARSGTPLCTLDELHTGPFDLRLHSGDEDGWIPLREAVGARYGVNSAGVALAHGATMANHLAAALLLDQGGKVLFERPGYGPILDLAAHRGADVDRFDRRGGTLTAAVEDALRSGIRLVVLTDPHNPTGTLAEEADLQRLADLAEERDFHVLIDEVYLDLAPPERVRTAARLSPRIVATGSLTKSFGLGGLRIGWVLADPEVAEDVRRLNDLYSVLIAHPSERLGLQALQRAEEILEPRRMMLARNREVVDAFIADRSELEWVPPEAGTVGWVRLFGPSPDDLARLLEQEYESTVVPGRFFSVPDYFRIGLTLWADDLDAALDRLGSALDRLR